MTEKTVHYITVTEETVHYITVTEETVHYINMTEETVHYITMTEETVHYITSSMSFITTCHAPLLASSRPSGHFLTQPRHFKKQPTLGINRPHNTGEESQRWTIGSDLEPAPI